MFKKFVLVDESVNFWFRAYCHKNHKLYEEPSSDYSHTVIGSNRSTDSEIIFFLSPRGLLCLIKLKCGGYLGLLNNTKHKLGPIQEGFCDWGSLNKGLCLKNLFLWMNQSIFDFEPYMMGTK
jgi:hypothetical protein